jgi:uncharacterized membrane protein
LYNFHPPFTAFPLALLSAVTLLELLSLRGDSAKLQQAVRINLILGAIFTLLAFYSGYQASELATLSAETEPLVARHHNFGRLLLLTVWPCLGLKFVADQAKYNAQLFKAAYWASLLLAQALVVYTGWLGGELVFTHSVGVAAP